MPEMMLVGHGPVSWDEVRELARGLRTAWTDYAGFQVEDTLPDQCPPSSHIWAWPIDPDTTRWLRIRPDGGGGAVVAELRAIRPEGELLPDGGANTEWIPVRLDVVTASSTPSRQRTTPIYGSRDTAEARFHLLEVISNTDHPSVPHTPVTFVHEGDAPRGIR